MTEEQICLALRDCYDPEIPLNIVDLGLINSIRLGLDPDAPGAGIPGVPARYRLELTLISASVDEHVHAQLTALVHNRLAGLEQLARIAVQLAREPLWTPARISAEGRRSLGLDQPLFPILNNRVR